MSLGARAIDMHAHWVPPQVAHALRQRQGQVPRLEVLADGAERLVMPIGTLGFSQAHTDPSLRLQRMLQQGVAKQMLSLPGLFGIDSLPFDQSAPLVRAFNDRGSYLCHAEVSARARLGVVVGLGIWWRKMGPGGTNVNELTSQALTDMGRAPTFYDCAVEVKKS